MLPEAIRTSHKNTTMESPTYHFSKAGRKTLSRPPQRTVLATFLNKTVLATFQKCLRTLPQQTVLAPAKETPKQTPRTSIQVLPYNPGSMRHLHHSWLHPYCQLHHLQTVIVIENNTFQDHFLQQTAQEHYHHYHIIPFQDHNTWQASNSDLHYYQLQPMQGHQPQQAANNNHPCHHLHSTITHIQHIMEQSLKNITIHCYTFQSSY